MSYQGTTSNNEITEEDNISQAQRSVLEAQQHQYQSSNPDTVVTLKETGAMTFLSTESGGTLNHEDDVTLFVAYDGEWEYDNKEWFFENSKGSTIDVLKCITVSEITNKLYKQLDVNKEVYHIKLEVHYRTTGSPWFPVTEIQNNKDLSVFISETSKTRIPLCVSRSLAWVAQAEIDGERKKVFVAYGGIWEYDVEKKRELFKNSKSSTISVPKRITLSELKDILYKHLDVDKKSYRLKLEVDDDKYEADDDKYEFHYEIKDDTDISKFISETSETKLPLFVTRIYDEMSSDVAGERRKGTVTIFVTYDGKWEYNGKEWFFKNSRRGLMLDVPKHITLSKIIDVLNKKLRVNEKLYRLKLEVHYRTGSPCFPIIEIENDRDLLKFISETSKTKVPLCVTELRHYPDQSPRDATAKNSVLKAIVKGDWVTAKEIIKNNTEEVTWTSKLDDYGNTAFHYAVGRYKDDEVVREILMGIEEATRTSKLDDYDNKAFLFAVGRNKVVREILMGIEEATWTSKLDDYDNTSFHFAVGRYKENKVVRKILCELLVTTLNIIGWNPAHLAAFFDNTEALNMMLKFSPICLFIPNDKDLLPIHCALQGSTFRYLFMKMQSYKDEFDIVLRGNSGLMLLSQVIDRGLIGMYTF